MKKSVLFSAALLAVSSAFAASPLQKADASKFTFGPKAPESVQRPATRATQSFDFSYSGEIYSLTKLSGVTGGKTRVYLMFELSPNDIKGLAGDKVTGFTVYSSSNQNMNSNSITEGRFFCSRDLTKEDYSQNFSFSGTPFDENNISLDTPYTINGDEESLFFGYSIVVPKNDNMYYIPFDGNPNPYPGAGVFSASDSDAFPSEFYSFSYDLGALVMSITVEGDNFPTYAIPAAVPNKIYLPMGKESSSSISVMGLSDEPIESVAIEYSLDGKQYTSDYVLPNALPAGMVHYFNASINLPAVDKMVSENVTFTIAKMNGKPNVADGASVTIPVSVLAEVPVRQTLMEEYTSTSCPWCTRGFAALEYIKNNYPEFVVASFHTQYNTPDPMQVVNTFPNEPGGYPSAFLNRTAEVDPFYGDETYMDMTVPIVGNILNLNSIPTPWKISVAHEWESDNILVAKADVANFEGYENETYRIAYLLVADGLTGKSTSWYQSNNYASYAPDASYPEELKAFCRGGEYGKSRVAGLVFNDVVVSGTGIYGVDGSVPASLEAGAEASHTISFDLSKISSTLIPDKNKLRVIAAVVDESGAVMNCAKDEVNDFSASAVSGINNENAPVEFFNLNGMKVAQPTEGIFIRRQGSKAEKVIIK